VTAPQWEPSAEQVKAIHALWAKHYVSKRPPELADMGTAWVAFAEDVVRRQHEREAGLLAFIFGLEHNTWGTSAEVRENAKKALAAHAKLDAPKVPTLLEAAKALLGGPFNAQANHEHWNALKAAVEREEDK